MATPDILQKEKDLLLYASISEGDAGKSRGSLIERKIEILEGLTSNFCDIKCNLCHEPEVSYGNSLSTRKVSNGRSRRLLNDRRLMELVPRLNAEEIRGLFAPPPWGEEVPVSPFCMANMREWDKFRNRHG